MAKTAKGEAVMRDEMNRIQICKYCGKPEYYGKFIWLNGKMLCRDCYKKEYHRTQGKPYEWNDLDGQRPTFAEYAEQEKEKEDA